MSGIQSLELTSESRAVDIPTQFGPEDLALRRVRRAIYLAALAAMEYGPGSPILEDRNVEADVCLTELVNLREAQRRNH